MSAIDAINKLMEIHPKGFDLSLDRITALLEKLQNPQLRIPPVIHIAGTNGKGSTAAFLRAILEAAGKTTHVHSSPHLVNWYERYRLGDRPEGKFVDDEVLEEAVNRVAAANNENPITVFEIMSAVAFVLFSEHFADYSIIEVGLGGRFDATNVIIDPLACIITPVGLDHQAYLGDTLPDIAYEKAGIIKKNIPVIVGEQADDSLQVIEEQALKNSSQITVARQNFDYYLQNNRFIFQDELGLLDLPVPALHGEHQLANASLAIATTRQLLPDLSNDVYETAVKTVYWPGRFERLSPGPIANSEKSEIWIDGGHNGQAANMIADELETLNSKYIRSEKLPTILIVGMLTTKEPLEFFRPLINLVDHVIAIPVEASQAGFTPEELAKTIEGLGISVTTQPSLEEAMAEAKTKFSDQNHRILISGSLYLVGEVLQKNNTIPK